MVRGREEDRDLEALHAWCKQHGLFGWHTENERKRNVAQQAMAKRKGLRAGVSDYLIVHRKLSIAIELKHGNNRPTKAQDEFLRTVEDSGWLTFVGSGRDAILWLRRRFFQCQCDICKKILDSCT